jgi:hypothetical protein
MTDIQNSETMLTWVKNYYSKIGSDKTTHIKVTRLDKLSNMYYNMVVG